MPIDLVTTTHSLIIPEILTQSYPLWHGKTVQPLSPGSNSLLQKGIQFSDRIPQLHTSSSNPFRNIQTIPFEWYSEEPEPGWRLADPFPYILPNEEENLTVEELLVNTGAMFAPSHDLQIIPCKSAKKVLVHWWKVGTKWVKEHKTELIIGGVVLGVGGGIALGVTLLASTAAAETVAATTAAVGTAVASSSKRKEDEPTEKPQEAQEATSSPPPPPSSLPIPIIGYELPKDRPPTERESSTSSSSSRSLTVPSMHFEPPTNSKPHSAKESTLTLPPLLSTSDPLPTALLFQSQLRPQAKIYSDYLIQHAINPLTPFPTLSTLPIPPDTPIHSEEQLYASMFQTIQKGFAYIGANVIDNFDLFQPNSPADPFYNAYKDLVKEHQTPKASKVEAASLLLSIASLKSNYHHFLNLLAVSDIGSTLYFPPGPHPVSTSYTVEGMQTKGMQHTMINGMCNSFDEAYANAKYLQSFTSMQIDGIYNHSNGILDPCEIIFLNLAGYSPITEDLIMKKFVDFAEANKDDPHAKCMHECHSQGAIHTRNVLEKLPPHIRERVIVVSIAGGRVIPKRLCFDSYNYVSKLDKVPRFQYSYLGFLWAHLSEEEQKELFEQEKKDAEEIIVLEPHPDATGWDHSFQSPTYRKELKRHSEEYQARKGRY